MRQSSLNQAPVQPDVNGDTIDVYGDVTSDVTSDAAVNDDPRPRSGTQEPQLEHQLDELDRHRQMVQKMSNKVIELHTKVNCDQLYTSSHCSNKAANGHRTMTSI